jgi:hypothetical protein
MHDKPQDKTNNPEAEENMKNLAPRKCFSRACLSPRGEACRINELFSKLVSAL